MNILVEQLPTAVEIDGQEYEINSDYRTCLSVILAFEDEELTSVEKSAVMIENLYPTKPHNLAEAVKMGLKFLNGGEEGDAEKAGPRVYSFGKDAQLVFAAFKQTHGIDLAETDMHWWKFFALFMDLGKNTTFNQLVSLRKRVKTGKATPEERRAAKEIGDTFYLPEIDTRTSDEKDFEEEFLRQVEEGKRNREKAKSERRDHG